MNLKLSTLKTIKMPIKIKNLRFHFNLIILQQLLINGLKSKN